MKKDTHSRGFIIKLMVVVVGICLVFLVVATLAGQTSLSTLVPVSVGGITGGGVTNLENSTNPMLDFMGTGGSDTSLETGRTVPNTDGKGVSVYSGKVNLSTGNTYSIQPLEEYVTIRNGGSVSVNITGWTLTNGKGSRPIQNSSNSYVYPTPDTAVIGQGTEFLDPSGKFNVGPVVLKAGDTAYVMTGGPFTQFPLSISTNFRENICMGYIENYPFSPAINRMCPDISNDPQVRTLTDECYDYVDSLSRCANPQKNDKKTYDKQPSHCKAFIDARVGYPQCVAQNSNLKNFSMNQWRVFLGKTKEMWANQRETITLYDAQGKVVDQITY